MECGVRSIEHANLIDEPTAQLVAERGVYVVPTLVVYEELHRRGADLGLSEVNLAKLQEIERAGIEMLDICRRAGVKLGLGTDLLGELLDAQCHEFLIQAEVLGSLEALRSGTSVNAEILQMEGRLGVIAEGALADIIVVDGDPLADLGLLQDEGRAPACHHEGRASSTRTCWPRRPLGRTPPGERPRWAAGPDTMNGRCWHRERRDRTRDRCTQAGPDPHEREGGDGRPGLQPGAVGGREERTYRGRGAGI